MAPKAKRTYGDEVPDHVIDELRAICEHLPDAYEERAWVGVRWRVRKRTFAQVLTVAEQGADPNVVLSFRSEGEELEVLTRTGPPFFVLWGENGLGLVIDDDTDWDEVRELVTDSFCVMAPKKLASRVQRPPAI